MFCTLGRLELALGGNRRRGFRLVSPAEGTGAMTPVHFNQLHAACAYGQTHARCTRSAPPPPVPRQFKETSVFACLLFLCRALVAGQMMAGRIRAAAQEVHPAEWSDACVRCFGTNGWQSRWLWQKRRTTPHEDRSLPQLSGRRWSIAYGHRAPPLGVQASLRAQSDRSRRHFSGECLPTLGLPVRLGRRDSKGPRETPR